MVVVDSFEVLVYCVVYFSSLDFILDYVVVFLEIIVIIIEDLLVVCKDCIV